MKQRIMRKSIYLIAALSTGLFASCSSDSVPTESAGQGQARIELTLTGNTIGTRANGASLPTDDASGEQKVNNIVIGIFNNSGNVLSVQDVSTPKVGTGDANKNVIICPLSGASAVTCSAVVVANVPASSIATLKTSTTKTDFLGKTITLSESTVSSNVQVSTNLPMSGDILDSANSDAATFSLTPGGTKTGLAVQLTRMASRITLTSLKSDFSNSPYPSATFKLQRIFLRDAIAATKVTTSATPSDAMSGTTYVTGGGVWSGTAWSGINPYLVDDLGTPLAITSSTTLPGSKYYWFYAFANDGSTSPTSFVIQGLFDADGSDTTTDDVSTVFYPVIVNKTQPGTTYNGSNVGTSTGSISRNNLYNLAVNLKNKGISSPTDNINPANLEINVTVASWPAAIVQSVDFN